MQRIFDEPGAVTMSSHVLPHVDVDYVSFSAYSSLGGNQIWNSDPATGINTTRLTQALVGDVGARGCACQRRARGGSAALILACAKAPAPSPGPRVQGPTCGPC